MMNIIIMEYIHSMYLLYILRMFNNILNVISKVNHNMLRIFYIHLNFPTKCNLHLNH